ELKRAVEQEQDLAGQLARMKVRQGDIGEDLVRLRELERDSQVKRAAYERAMQASQSGGATGASIISHAEPPLRASGPSVSAFSLAGALAGLLAGLGFGGWRRESEVHETAAITPAQASGPQASESGVPAEANL